MLSRYMGKTIWRVLDDGSLDPSILITWPEKAVTIGGERVRIKMVEKNILEIVSTGRKDPNNEQQNDLKNVLRFEPLSQLVTPTFKLRISLF